MLLMIPAMVLLVAAYVHSHRTALRHPMLMGVTPWTFAHLMANGDLASVLLFGNFLA